MYHMIIKNKTKKLTQAKHIARRARMPRGLNKYVPKVLSLTATQSGLVAYKNEMYSHKTNLMILAHVNCNKATRDAMPKINAVTR